MARRPHSHHPLDPPKANRSKNDGPKGRNRVVGLQQAGLLTAIPFVLLIGPALGYYLGIVADRRWGAAPWGMGVGIVVGLLASAKVTMQLIRQARDLDPHD